MLLLVEIVSYVDFPGDVVRTAGCEQLLTLLTLYIYDDEVLICKC